MEDPRVGHGSAEGLKSRKVAFALLPLVLLGVGAECVLRLKGWQGNPDRTVSWCREHALQEPPFFPLQPLEGRMRFHAPLVEGQPRAWSVDKGPGVRRLFALGGSAVHGYGFTRVGAWPDKLEERLATAWPDTEVQVINAGVIAWSSQQLLSLTKDILENHQPDALLIYAGNNELLEWFDARKYLPPRDLRRWVRGVRWSRRARTFRLYQWMAQWLGSGVPGGRAPGHWGQTEFTDDEALDWPDRAPMREADRAFAIEGYRTHIERILSLAEASGVPVILATVAVNETEAPGEFDFGATRPGEVTELLELGAHLWREGDIQSATAQVDEARRIWPQASVEHDWGMTLRDFEDPGARAVLRRAIHIDENPHRALPAINDVVRDLAVSAAGLVDVEALFSEASIDGIVDGSLLYDYCHPTPASHDRIADAMGAVLTTEVWPGGEPAEAPPAGEGHVDAFLGLGVDPESGSYVRNPGVERFGWWQEARVRVEESPEDVEAWNHLGTVVWHTFHADCDRGRAPCLPEALESFGQAVNLDAGFCPAWANLGRVGFALQHESTGEWLDQAVRCDVSDVRSSWYLARWDRLQDKQAED